MKIKIATVDVTTGETLIEERDETVFEKKAREKAEADFATEKAEAEAKAAQRQALLSRLGITEEEAKLLLS